MRKDFISRSSNYKTPKTKGPHTPTLSYTIILVPRSLSCPLHRLGISKAPVRLTWVMSDDHGTSRIVTRTAFSQPCPSTLRYSSGYQALSPSLEAVDGRWSCKYSIKARACSIGQMGSSSGISNLRRCLEVLVQSRHFPPTVTPRRLQQPIGYLSRLYLPLESQSLLCKVVYKESPCRAPGLPTTPWYIITLPRTMAARATRARISVQTR